MGLFDEGITAAQMAVLAGDLDMNAVQIDLVGLADTGLRSLEETYGGATVGSRLRAAKLPTFKEGASPDHLPMGCTLKNRELAPEI